MSIGEGYLPPVVAQIMADSGDLVAKLEMSKALLDKFDATVATATLTADDTPAILEAAKARAALEGIASKPIAFTLTADSSGAVASGAAAAAAGAAGGGGRGGKGGASSGFLAGLLGGKGAGGFLGTGTGTGGYLPGLPAPAAFGTLAGFAGFGAEHILGTAAGIGASGLGAMGGAGLLGAGSLGISAVGAGSDTAVMKSTLADTQALSKSYQQLQTDIALYGANSKQAKADTAALNVQMAELGNTAGVQAEMGLVKASDALNTQWDKATSGARVAAVNIMQQVVSLGATYVPLVAAAAQRNLTIINTGLRPLFAWLKGPEGVGIFQDLENMFAKRLPIVIDTFTKAVEVFAKTIDYAAQQSTGHFISKLDEFFTKLNSPAGFQVWEGHIQNMIGMFHDWEALLVVAGNDLRLFFGGNVSTGVAIVQTLTDMLTKLQAWLQTGKGQAEINKLFTAHKDEIIQILGLLPAFLSAFGKIYLTIAPALTEVVAQMARFINWLSNIPGVGPLLEIGLAIAIIANKLGLISLLKNAFGFFQGIIQFGQALLGVSAAADAAAASEEGLAAKSEVSAATSAGAWVRAAALKVAAGVGWVASEIAQIASSVAANVAGAAEATGAWIAAVARKIAAGAAWAVEQIAILATVVAAEVMSAAESVGGWVAGKVVMIAAAVEWAAAQLAQIATVVAANIAGALASGAAWVAANPEILLIVAAVAAIIAIVVELIQHWQDVSSAIGAVAQAVGGFIYSYMIQPIHELIDLIGGALSAVFNGVASVISGVVQGAFSIIKDVIQGIADAVGVLANSIQAISSAFGAVGDAASFLWNLPGNAVNAIAGRATGGPVTPGGTYVVGEKGMEILQMGVSGGGYVTPMVSGGVRGVGGSNGATNISVSIPVSVNGSATPQTAQQIGVVVERVVRGQLQQLVKQLNGGAYNVSLP